LKVLAIIILAVIITVAWCALALSGRISDLEATQLLTPADWPALRLLLRQEGIAGEPLSGRVEQRADGSVWVVGEVQVAPGLVREYQVRAGHADERPTVEK